MATGPFIKDNMITYLPPKEKQDQICRDMYQAIYRKNWAWEESQQQYFSDLYQEAQIKADKAIKVYNDFYNQRFTIE